MCAQVGIIEMIKAQSFPEAEEIITYGMKHNDFPSQIMKSIDEAGIPLPGYQQLNNEIAYLRKH